MALKIPINWVSFNQLGFVQNKKKIESCSSSNGGLVKVRKWECLGMRLVEAERAVEDDKQKQQKQPLSSDEKIDENNKITESVKGFHKDLNSLPKPLSATDLVSSGNDGSKVRVAYQGLPGAYSEAAALKAYPKCETVPCDQFESVFKAVELWLVDKAVLPIENSVGGSIHRNYDLLLRHRLHIVGEVQMVVNHCLLGVPGVRKEELKRVLSHPQALDQCENALNKLGVIKVSAEDTALAAQIVASDGIRDTGAIASSRAADIYGLDILAQNIQNDLDNVTRFLILAREPIIPGTDKPHKTSIVFTLEEGPGVLFKALAVFALREINLSKIESRPQRKRPLRIVDDSNKGSAKYFDYLFYIDFEASMAEPRAQYALGHLQEFSRFLRVLGCYPMDTAL
ncbi:arogenate dehydratase [Artemisia annua]|uniref:Arogenate dehydratase n=1 Tax=Artemisia annua TaxID=35608 RepID=A0A2U1PAT6_ARTAN|nr:arogenate dehydratase [Artemisia annua]